VAPSTWQELVDEATREALDTATAGAALVRTVLPQWEVRSDHSLDSPYRAIIDQAEKHGVSLIVVGSHGRSTLGRMLLGSTSQFVLDHAQCSERVGRRSSTAPGSPMRVVVGVDGSAGSFAAIHEVTRRHWPEGTAFGVFASVDLRLSAALAGHAAAAWADSRYLRHDPRAATPTQIVQAASELLREAGLSAVQVVEEGDPKVTLVEHALQWRADAIFVGATGLSRTQRFFLGSVSNAIAARAHCSVEVVRSLEGMTNVIRGGH
jgi:nucleotide-binding universal stress UspA family protein